MAATSACSFSRLNGHAVRGLLLHDEPRPREKVLVRAQRLQGFFVEPVTEHGAAPHTHLLSGDLRGGQARRTRREPGLPCRLIGTVGALVVGRLANAFLSLQHLRQDGPIGRGLRCFRSLLIRGQARRCVDVGRPGHGSRGRQRLRDPHVQPGRGFGSGLNRRRRGLPPRSVAASMALASRLRRPAS